jgi:phosphonate transport system substrate-binding protein
MCRRDFIPGQNETPLRRAGERQIEEMLKRLFTYILVLPILTSTLWGEQEMEPLHFGAITTVKPEIVKRRFEPLLEYLSEKLGRKIIFETGRNYDDTIEKFTDGTFDFGYIGPSPYIIACRRKPGSLKIVAGIVNGEERSPYFRSAIVTSKTSDIEKLSDLNGRRFAFGSPRSTLSFYMPWHILSRNGILKSLSGYDFLGRHDIVAKNVIMGIYDAGGIKMSVARKYSKYLKTIAKSEPVTDFAIVAHSSLDEETVRMLRSILYSLDDPKILRPIKSSLSGFAPRKDSDYDNLRRIMRRTEKEMERGFR